MAAASLFFEVGDRAVGGGGGGGGGFGGGIGWVGHGRGTIGGYLARCKARRQVLDATEAELNSRDVPIPEKYMSQAQIFWIGFVVGLLLGLLIGLVFWELT